jgi:metal-dependent amidase/aminoacylase/carboxypeptidase family protein
MLPTLRRVLGDAGVRPGQQTTTAEDFSYFQQAVPGLFVFLGITPKDQLGKAAPNHSPRWFADEAALVPGMRTLASLAMDYLGGTKR